jgi:6-pyruvoyl-tetrahydropterin synthase
MTQVTSTMFLCDTTNVDHAYIDDTGMVVGGSYRPKFLVEGNVDADENVVIDFSAVKKSIKASIDDPETGFDHKLWWIEGYSAGEIKVDQGRVKIETPKVTVIGPSNIVRVVGADEDVIGAYVQHQLSVKYPDVDVNVHTTLTTTFDTPPQMNTDAHQFRYVHGLKKSTSFGCQNIGHGHLSYLGASTTNKLASDLVLARIAAMLDGTVFAWSDNVADVGSTIEYDSNRGHMKMDLVDEEHLIVLDTETTVEHLAEWIASQWHDDLVKAGVYELYVSEGLSKGACVAII